MMKLSSIYGKEVLSSAGRRGYVLSVNAKNGRLSHLLCADENEREFTVGFSDITRFGDPILYHGETLSGKEDNCDRAAAVPVRLGRAGFDAKGGFLGFLEDFTFSGDRLINAKIGKKNYPAEEVVLGDVVIVKPCRKLSDDVKKDGKVLLKKGAPLTANALDAARKEGEYVQAQLKSL